MGMERDAALAELSARLDRMEAALERASRPSREFLDTPEAARFVGLSRGTLEEMRSQGGGPAYHKVGRRVVYAVRDLRDFLAARRTEPLR